MAKRKKIKKTPRKQAAHRTHSARNRGGKKLAALVSKVVSKAVTRTGQWRPAFLKHLAASGDVTASASVAGVDRRTVYDAREKDDQFASAWASALAEVADALEAEMLRRAKDGVADYVTHQGQVVMLYHDRASGQIVDALTAASNPEKYVSLPLVERTYSDGLAQFLLKAMRPEKYRERVDVKAKIERPGTRTAAEAEAEADQLLAELAGRTAGLARAASPDQDAL